MTEQSQNRRPTALVVDDQPLLRIDMADVLDLAGFETLEAADGDTAIVLLEEHHLDVAVLFSDVDMPGSRDGFALAREVAVKWPKISIVIASGRRAPSDGEMPDGARFIGKPFSAKVVHGHLREIVPDHLQPDELQG